MRQKGSIGDSNGLSAPLRQVASRQNSHASYFFHLYDSASSCDGERSERPDHRSARDQAIKAAGAVLRENPDSLWRGAPGHMKVVNGGRRLLSALNFALRQDRPEADC
ncbi:DUF6894 family protein [Muricoccus aerilatus]|uniref:DUF6894 family protein n=1 Tax=Muricoccus aerilatus TaxID=452982 RepID=UPI0038CD1316